MPTQSDEAVVATPLAPESIRARARVLAREDYAMKAALITLRKDAGLSQKQLAERMGISQQAVHKLERYDADPKLSTIRRYANAVGALVRHRVTRDEGQSVRLAGASPWALAPTATTTAMLSKAEPRDTDKHRSWSKESRVDLALAS